MLLYAQHISPRLLYIVDFISNTLFDETIVVTGDTAFYQQYTGPRINYADARITSDELYLQPHGLLQENNIHPIDINCFVVNEKKAFFRTEDSDFPFDLLAASFYLLSRYEEYLPHEKDLFGRYEVSCSLAWKEGFLNQPLVNLWLQDFKQALQQKFPTLLLKRSKFKFIPTYDIDIAWSYKHKGWKRTIGSFIRYIYTRNWPLLKERIAVLRNKQRDPYDCYEWLDALHLYCRLRPYYFFLLADKQTKQDRNINPAQKALQQLVAYQYGKGTVGLHPSWQSGDNPKLLKEEAGWIEFMTGHETKYSRQHYIRFTLPDTFRRLIKLGIEMDFSMGYGSANGFRASVASSFYWYDLEKEEKTSLRLFPFCFMDATAMHVLKLTPKETFEELMYFYRTIKAVNGLMITIWHNNFFGSDPRFKGWKEVYEIFLREEIYWESL